MRVGQRIPYLIAATVLNLAPHCRSGHHCRRETPTVSEGLQYLQIRCSPVSRRKGGKKINTDIENCSIRPARYVGNSGKEESDVSTVYEIYTRVKIPVRAFTGAIYFPRGVCFSPLQTSFERARQFCPDLPFRTLLLTSKPPNLT